jgi:hypothetical protein
MWKQQMFCRVHLHQERESYTEHLNSKHSASQHTPAFGEIFVPISGKQRKHAGSTVTNDCLVSVYFIEREVIHMQENPSCIE